MMKRRLDEMRQGFASLRAVATCGSALFPVLVLETLVSLEHVVNTLPGLVVPKQKQK